MRGGKKMGNYGGTPSLKKGEGRDSGVDGAKSSPKFPVSPKLKVYGGDLPTITQKSEAHYAAILKRAMTKTGQESD